MAAAQSKTALEWRKEFIRQLQANTYRHDLYNVFSDFLEMAAIAIANVSDIRQREGREARYMEIVKRYSSEEVEHFGNAYGALVMALETAEFDDLLGSVFMELELGSSARGQFFTPYDICRLMAMMNLSADEMAAQIEAKGYITANDPSSGGGAQLIAMAHAMKDKGINFQECMYAVGQDIDIKAVHMAYVQLSLLGIPGVIVHGNTLTTEEYSRWYTPMHFLGAWNYRLHADQRPESLDVAMGKAEPAMVAAHSQPQQLSLMEVA